MKFRIVTSVNGHSVTEHAVHWIKAFRAATDLGLRDSKWTCDAIRNKLSELHYYPAHIEIDTTVDTQLAFLDDLNSLSFGDMIQRVGHVPTTATDPSIVLLERTAIRLIRMGSYDKARDVLRILI